MILRSFVTVGAFLFWSAAASAAVRPEIARLLPPDAVTIGGFDMQALRGTPLFSKLAGRLPVGGDERMDQIFAAAGFDPKEDIHHVLAASAGDADKPNLVIVEGDFDLEGRGRALFSAFTKVGEHGGVTLYETTGEGRGDDATFAFLDAGIAVAGAALQVRSAIDRWVQPAEPSKVVAAALAQKDAHVWAATLEPDKFIGPWIGHIPGGGGPFRAIAESMQSLAIRATALTGAVHAEVALLCGGTDDARSLADAIQALTAFGALTVQRDRPEVAEMLGKVQVRQNESETTLSLQLTEEQFLGLHR